MTTATIPQHMVALAEANRVRFARAQLCRDLNAGRKKFIPLILDPPEYAENMKVMQLLKARRRVARLTALRIMRTMNMHEHRTLGSLTERQRRQLAAYLRSKGWE